MDNIKLDRVQPFARESPQPTRSLKRNDPMEDVTPSTRSSLNISTNSIKKASKAYTGMKFTRLRESIVPPFNVPSTVIPIYANAPEVELYEKTFERPKYLFEKLSMSDVLEPYHVPQKSSEQRYIMAKVNYLRHFFLRIQSAGVNYDVAVLARDEKSETMLKKCFDTFCHVPISYFAPEARVYGVIFKFRKHKPQPVSSRSVDLMIAYDSACNIHHPEAFGFFTGTHRDRPWLINLCIADSADIRIYNFNLCNPNHPIHWDTRVTDLPSPIANRTLYQPNRSTPITTASGWVDYITRQLINWVIKKDGSEYMFAFPTKSFLYQFVREFKYGHPPVNARPAFPISTLSKSAKKNPSPSRPSVRPDLNLVGYASASALSSIANNLPTTITQNNNKRKHDTPPTEPRKQAKNVTSGYVNQFLPDLRAEPRKPRPATTTTWQSREENHTDDFIPLDAPPAAAAPIATTTIANPQEYVVDSSVPVDGQIVTPSSSITTTTSNNSASILPVAEDSATKKTTVDFSKIDDIFAEALAQFEKDLDAIKIKL